MPTAKNRVSRTIGRPPQRRTDFRSLGEKGKKALGEKVAALRASGPGEVLDWINEDPILQSAFSAAGLARIGRPRTIRGYSRMLTPSGKPADHLMIDKIRTTTLLTVSERAIGTLVRHDVGSPLIQYARTILERLALARVEWLTRIRRCPVEACPRMFFWDATDAADKRACLPAHKRAASRAARRQK